MLLWATQPLQVVPIVIVVVEAAATAAGDVVFEGQVERGAALAVEVGAGGGGADALESVEELALAR